MATIAKEKQFIVYTTDKNKIYRYDINTNCWYGLKNNIIHTSPTDFRKTLLDHTKNTSNLIQYLREFVRYRGAANLNHMTPICRSALLTADKLDSAGLPVAHYSLSDFNLNTIGQNFAKFIKYYKEWKESHDADYHDQLDWAYRDFIATLEQEEAERKMKLYKDTIDGMDEKTQKWFTDFMSRRGEASFTAHEWCIIGSCAKSSLGQFLLATDNTIMLCNTCTEMVKYSKALDVELTKSKDYTRYYMELKNSYIAQKDACDARLFTQHYDKKRNALSFENDKYIVVIPTAPNDIITEGARQKNCVAGYRDKVINGNGYIVFVRHKDDVEKNYITCEVYNNGKIGQYYRACNANIRTPEEHDFYRAYAQHLNDNWNK